MAPAAKIICNTCIEGADEYYGRLVNRSFTYDDGSPVIIKEFLGVKFKSPPVTAPILVDVQLYPDDPSDPKITQPDENGVVTAQIFVKKPHTFGPNDNLSWEINGNLLDHPDTYAGSFEFYADELPSGTIEVQCADAPHSDLTNAKQTVVLDQGGVLTKLSTSPGSTKSFTVFAGGYTVSASELANDTQTTVAIAYGLPRNITVRAGEKTTLKVTYGAVTNYSAIDVTLGQLSPPVSRERFHVTITDTSSGKLLEDFFSANNHKTELRRLPTSGEVKIEAQITLNNVKYDGVKTTPLSHDLIEVQIDESDVKQTKVDTSGFVNLPITVQTDCKLPDASVHVRLVSLSMDMIYAQAILVRGGKGTFPVPVARGEYTVEVTGFIHDSTVYAVQGPSSLTVEIDRKSELALTARCGANLQVHGFPSFLSFGALTDLSDPEGNDFIAAQASSIFKYAGNDGAGDLGEYLSDDPATTSTIELAAKVETGIGHDLTVLPIMISYTVELSSDSDPWPPLHDEQRLAHGFGNLILSLQLAKQHSTKPVPAGYIVNPDFLGACQRHSLSPDYSMPVRTPLQEALQYRNVDVAVPDSITNTLSGYVLAVNWLIRTVAEKVTFGWQANLWGVKSAAWIYNKDPKTPALIAKETADYIKTLGVYGDSGYHPNFLAIDRFEADDFTRPAYGAGFCFGPYEWGRFFDYCGHLSLELQVPVAPWQISAARIPNKNEEPVCNLEAEHWGSGGTYIFGDANINSDYRNIHPKILGIKLWSDMIPYPNVEELFVSAPAFDLSFPAYPGFPVRGIFTVLLGGPSTTGIISTIGKTGPWTQDKISEYMQDPIPLDGTDSTRLSSSKTIVGQIKQKILGRV